MAEQAFQFTTDDSHALHLTGQVSFANAGAALAALPALRGAVAMDLQGVTDADSAALAVLVAWAARAHEQGARLRYLQPPASLRNLAHLCDLDGLFE